MRSHAGNFSNCPSAARLCTAQIIRADAPATALVWCGRQAVYRDRKEFGTDRPRHVCAFPSPACGRGERRDLGSAQKRPNFQPSLCLNSIVVELALIVSEARRGPDNQAEEIIQAARCCNVAMILV